MTTLLPTPVYLIVPMSEPPATPGNYFTLNENSEDPDFAKELAQYTLEHWEPIGYFDDEHFDMTHWLERKERIILTEDELRKVLESTWEAARKSARINWGMAPNPDKETFINKVLGK